ALPGIPLDDSYARYAAKEQPQLEVDPGASNPAVNAPPAGGSSPAPPPTKAAAIKPTIINGPPIRMRSRQAVASANDDDVVVIKPRDTSDPVVGVFRDMFGLFGSND